MRSIPFALLLSILAANTLLPQQKPKTQNPQQTPQPANGVAKFGTSLNLVVESVFAKDKNGKPIEGLNIKDFVITEDGVPQTILSCDYMKMEDNVLPAVTVTAPPIPTAAEKEKPKDIDPITRVQIAPGDIVTWEAFHPVDERQ